MVFQIPLLSLHCHMSVFLQNSSSIRCQCVLCKCSQSARAFIVFDTVHTVMDSLGPRWNLSYYTLAATVHKFLLLCDHLKLQLCWFSIQYCNTTGSYFFTYFKWLYTENKHLLHLKYINKGSEIQTADWYNISCTGTWGEECMNGVHVFWDHSCISVMFWYVCL
jgi:hypothetical protein